MAFRPAAEIGMPLAAVDTPCLVLELDAFERNLQRLPESLAGRDIRLRPHAKSHKCPEIARRQIALGAVGVCCQKVSEARSAGRRRHRRRADRERSGRRTETQAACRARAAREGQGLRGRRGQRAAISIAPRVRPASRSTCWSKSTSARIVAASRRARRRLRWRNKSLPARNLRFAGLQAYQGAAQHVRKVADRREAIARAVAEVRTDDASAGRGRHRLRLRDRRGHRQLCVRGGEQRLPRIAGRLLRFHGRRLRAATNGPRAAFRSSSTACSCGPR